MRLSQQQQDLFKTVSELMLVQLDSTGGIDVDQACEAAGLSEEERLDARMVFAAMLDDSTTKALKAVQR